MCVGNLCNEVGGGCTLVYYVCGMKETYRKLPTGLASEVATALGCSYEYAWKVLTGRVSNEPLKAKRIEKKAAEILAELNKPA